MTTHFRKTALAQLISTTLLAGATTMAYGQESSEAPVDAQSENKSVEEVVVHGIRGSLTQALDQKRNADTFIDVIVAEDIGKLPDDNLAETLQRIPGIQVEREDGEGVNVTIRGIRKNRLEVNGRTLLSPNGRGSSAGIMNYLPSEIVGSVRTSKVLTADMSDGALGGTINVKTRKPLDKKGFWGGASLEGSYAEMNSDQGFKGSALVSNTFNDDTMGVSFGAVYEDRPVTEDRFYSNGDWRQGSPYKDPADNLTGVADPYYYQYDLRYHRKLSERKKSAVTTAFQWRPSASLDVNADILYAKYDHSRSRAWAGIILEKTLEKYDSFVVDDRDARVAGTLLSKVENNHERSDGEDSFITGGVNATWYADNGMSVFVEYGFSESKSKSNQAFMNLYTKGPGNAGVPVDFDLRTADIPSVTIPNLSDPADLTAAVFYDDLNIRKAQEDSFRIDLDIPMEGIITSVKTGLRYSAITADRTKYAKHGVEPWSDARVTSLTRAGIGNTPVLDAPWLENALVTIDMSDVLSGSGANVPDEIVVVDTALIGNGGFGFSDAFYDAPIAQFPEYTSHVKDNIAAVYVRADFNIADWTGNVGLRYADTSTTVNNYALVDGVYEPFEKEGGYQDILPSLIVKKDLTDDLVLRIGASKIINRPPTSTLGATGKINVVDDDPATPEDESEGSSASLPNPDLKPQRGTQYDAALEWYFADSSALAAAVFYKTLDRQILNITLPGTIPGYGDQVFNIGTQINGGGGKIKGLELAYSHDFHGLPSILSNMGTSINYTYLDNTTDEIDPRTGDPIGLQGVSKNSVNVQVYYEDDKLSGRLLFNWRDDYFDRLGYAGATAILNKGEPSLDASIKYRISDSISVEFQTVNLLDTAKQEYAGWDEYVATYAETGTRYSLGMSVKF